MSHVHSNKSGKIFAFHLCHKNVTNKAKYFNGIIQNCNFCFNGFFPSFKKYFLDSLFRLINTKPLDNLENLNTCNTHLILNSKSRSSQISFIDCKSGRNMATRFLENIKVARCMGSNQFGKQIQIEQAY